MLKIVKSPNARYTMLYNTVDIITEMKENPNCGATLLCCNRSPIWILEKPPGKNQIGLSIFFTKLNNQKRVLITGTALSIMEEYSLNWAENVPDSVIYADRKAGEIVIEPVKKSIYIGSFHSFRIPGELLEKRFTPTWLKIRKMTNFIIYIRTLVKVHGLIKSKGEKE